jgi:hypothetical protein
MKIRYRYRFIHDEETSLLFFFDPKLVELRSIRLGRILNVFLYHVSRHFKRAVRPSDLWCGTLSDDVSARPSMRKSHHRWLRFVAGKIESSGFEATLEMLLSRSPVLHRNDSFRLRNHTVARVCRIWPYSFDNSCLWRAIFRWQWLIRRGTTASLVVGSHIPTDLMHSWVMVDSLVIGEEPEEMACFQEVCRIEAFPSR